MQLPTRQEALRYFRRQALGQFIGFYIGMSSAGLVSRFFETRRVANMWGLLAQKPLVEAGTFRILQQIAAVMIGFVVFEIISRNLKPFLERAKPAIENRIGRFGNERGLDVKPNALPGNQQ